MPCIIDSNKVVTTPIIDILYSLQQQLYLTHKNKIDTIDVKHNNARIRCPIHSNGCERTPSCDILLHDKEISTFDGKKIVNAGTVHCFGCGYQAGLVKFVADCLEISFKNSTDWLLGIAEYDILQDIRDIGDINFDKQIISDKYSNLPVITSDDLKKYDYIHQYMFKRRLTPEIIDKFDVGYSPEEDCLTFPVYVDGKCIFVAKRKVKYKMFMLPEIDPKPVYGMDYIDPTKDVYICESIINALTLWSYGLQAIALFGTGSSYQIDMLNKSAIRKFIICLDPDFAGQKGTKRLLNGLKNKIVTYIVYTDTKRDINDLTKSEFLSLAEMF